MFNEIEGLLQKVTTGEIDSSSVSQAAGEHVSSMNEGELKQQVQTAAGNAGANGQPGIAQQLSGLLSKTNSNPQAMKDEVISLIRSNPQILAHFEPAFVKNLLGRL